MGLGFLRPMPKLISAKILFMIRARSGRTSAALRLVRTALLPQPMSKPTPEGEVRPRYATTPPMGMEYPLCASAHSTAPAVSGGAAQRRICAMVSASGSPKITMPSMMRGGRSPGTVLAPIGVHLPDHLTTILPALRAATCALQGPRHRAVPERLGIVRWALRCPIARRRTAALKLGHAVSHRPRGAGNRRQYRQHRPHLRMHGHDPTPSSSPRLRYR